MEKPIIPMKILSINKVYVSKFISTCIPFTKNVGNPNRDILIVVKTSVPLKHPRSISPNKKCSTNQDRITFKS